MTDITKTANRAIPLNERSQVFTQADVSVGDIIRVQDSLGRAARRVIIEAVGAMTVNFNVYQTVYAQRVYTDDYWSQWSGELDNLAQGTEFELEDVATHSIGASSTFEINDDIPIKDIKVATAAGNFTITVM